MVIGPDNQPVFPPKVNSGPHAASKLLDELFEEEKRIAELLQINYPLVVTPELEARKERATRCEICKRKFRDGERKIFHHLNFLPTFANITCNKCNLSHKTIFIPVVAHNTTNDLSFLLRVLTSNVKRPITILARN